MTSGITEGISFFNYRGYYGVSGFESDDVNNTSNGFMLPVATPPNSIVYASNEIPITSMVKAGFWLNLMSIFLVFFLVYNLIPIIFE